MTAVWAPVHEGATVPEATAPSHVATISCAATHTSLVTSNWLRWCSLTVWSVQAAL